MSRSHAVDILLDSDSVIYAAENEYGWNDLQGPIQVQVSGAGKPAWTQFGATGFYAYAFAVNDIAYAQYHINHDYAQDTPVFFHMHWTTNGTSTNTVKWEFTIANAKGFDQANFNFSDPLVQTVEQAADGTAYRHMVAEVSTGALANALEVDGLIMVRIKRITNGGSENGDTVYGLTMDAHYQVERHATKNKRPNFYS